MRQRALSWWAWLASAGRKLGLPGPSGAPYEATRRRLLLLNLGVVSAILVVMAFAVYAAESQALQQQVDQNLISRARLDNDVDAQAIIASETGQGFTLPPSGETPDQGDNDYVANSPNIFTLVISADGTLVLDPSGASQVGLPDIANARPVLQGQEPYPPQTVTYSGQDFRIITVPLVTHSRQLVGALQVGQSLSPMYQQLRDLALRLLLVGIGMLALTAAASLYLADRALLPMRLAYDRQRQFTAAASHELRTPLAFVRSQLELVSRRLQRAASASPSTSSTSLTGPAMLETSGEDLSDTLNEVDYMTRLVRDLLLIARDDADHRSIAWEPVDVAELARDVASTIQPVIAERKLRLDVRGASDAIWVDGDRDRLRQLLLILLENATHYTPAGGTVWIEASQARGSLLARRRPLVHLVVGDTGAGIPLESQPRIFEAFYRAEGHHSGGDHGGAGLGLALARWIVTAHGGEIGLRSAPGQGSVFTIALPERLAQIADEDEDREDASASPPESSATKA